MHEVKLQSMGCWMKRVMHGEDAKNSEVEWQMKRNGRRRCMYVCVCGPHCWERGTLGGCMFQNDSIYRNVVQWGLQTLRHTHCLCEKGTEAAKLKKSNTKTMRYYNHMMIFTHSFNLVWELRRQAVCNNVWPNQLGFESRIKVILEQFYTF